MPALEYRGIDPAQALDFIFSAYERDRPYSLFDIRDADSYAQSHIPTAQHLPEREVGTVARALPRDQPVLIYCYHGHTSQSFAKTFVAFGFSEVYSIDGGFHALVHAFQHARQAAQAHG